MNAKKAEPVGSTGPAARRRPSRKWYLLALAIVLVTAGVFVLTILGARRKSWAAIEAMPRWVAPTPTAESNAAAPGSTSGEPEHGVVIELPAAGDYVVYYESRGLFEGRLYDTPVHQVWTTPTLAAMTCAVAPADGGAPLTVRLLGQTGDTPGEMDADRDTSVIYRQDVEDGRQGTGIWAVSVPAAGRYVVDIAYREPVYLTPEEVEVPPELTRDEQSQMRFEDVERYEQERAEQLAKLALASLEPTDVLFAIGPDPTAGSYFNVAGLKGAATLLAFGLTAGAIIALVTLMLRTGSVTERGTMENVRRGIGQRGS